ncbi:MAG: hypothetical protein A2Y33_08325 [Spirochaetes bacterium GWF1_51_8]|nr:MAG: hypothetical protein A2Y33_08325 [Spirochaetes bacterium GWF1_51_8]
MESTLTIKETIVESLNESLRLARVGIEYKKSKENGILWKQPEGILGFPVTILLCSITDAIGSYILGSKKSYEIIGDKDFYDFKDINDSNKANYAEMLYTQYRNPLIHNQIIREQYRLDTRNSDIKSLFILNKENGLTVYYLQVNDLFDASIKAVENFSKRIDTFVKEDSPIIKNSSAKLKKNYISNPEISDTKPTKGMSACCDDAGLYNVQRFK